MLVSFTKVDLSLISSPNSHVYWNSLYVARYVQEYPFFLVIKLYISIYCIFSQTICRLGSTRSIDVMSLLGVILRVIIAIFAQIFLGKKFAKYYVWPRGFFVNKTQGWNHCPNKSVWTWFIRNTHIISHLTHTHPLYYLILPLVSKCGAYFYDFFATKFLILRFQLRFLLFFKWRDVKVDFNY